MTEARNASRELNYRKSKLQIDQIYKNNLSSKAVIKSGRTKK